jgi:phage I-like protein
MTNQRTFVALAVDAIGEDGRQWIEVMPTVDEGDNGGKLFTVTADDLEVYAQSIRDNGGNTVVDYDHEGHRAEGSTKASGWFTGQAEVRATDRGPILCAEVQWTPPAAQSIRDGEYRFVSAEFSFHHRDAKTGLLTRAKDLVAATLTNRPFFRGLAPVAARLDDAQIDAIAAALHVERDLVVAAAAAAKPAEGQLEHNHDEGDEMTLLSTLRARLNLADDANEETVLATLDEQLPASETDEEKAEREEREAKAAADAEAAARAEADAAAAAAGDADARVALLQSANDKLTERVDELQQQVAARAQTEETKRRDDTVAAAISSGKIMAAEHDLYRQNLDINEAATLKVLASLPAGRVPLHERGVAPSSTDGAELGWFPQFTSTAANAAKEQ